jgi:hypothetical protein
VHDYFDILGLPTNAGANEVRRACARRVRRAHPDFREAAGVATLAALPAAAADPIQADIAIDFIDMSTLVERIQAGFFEGPLRHHSRG